MDGQVCGTCGETNPPDARLCGRCGSPLRQDEAVGEVYREVTLVTSDLKGSTALGERLDPEALREVLNRYFDVMRAVFESHGGTIEKIIGDAIVAVYGLPFRHDDDPLRAVEAASESQRALATLNDELEQGWGVRLVVRTGVASGEVTFGKADAGQHVLLGGPVEVSTVMEQNAPPLEVLLAESTYRLVADLVEVEDHGAVSPKGSDEQFASFRLVSVHERAAENEVVVPEADAGMRICPSCGEQSPERMRFCNTCGAALSVAVARESRRTVTIVFAMPKVHTLSGEDPSPQTLRDVMSRYFDAMRTALERHGGTVEKFIGDAVMAVFGLPVRHEDDALRAVRAAADMQSALDGLNPGFRQEFGLELSNHIGVNSGEVIAGDASTAQRMVTGDAVNTAARLEQAAGSGEVVLGDLTYRLARDRIEVEFMAPLELKGKAEPVPAYRLVSASATAAAPSADKTAGTPFVGREAEMARLGGGLDEAISERVARLVTVVGDAGVGKSRLIREFATAAQERARLVRGRCLPYGDGITFWPLAEVVREAAGITGEDTPRVATRRIDRMLERAGAEDREAIVERVAAAINLSAAQFPVAELMWGGRRFLETLATERPLVVLVDDLHWAEQTFLDFLDSMLETVDAASILILGSARHEISERHAEWAAVHEPMLVNLHPLSEADAGRIVEELLGSLEETVRSRIAAAAEGNPLYVEQIVSMLVETGAIERGVDGWVARDGAAKLQIPPTVQALVASRLDALKTEERAVVDPASVIGLTFALDAVSELVDDEIQPGLKSDLDVLVTKQLVRQLPEEEVLYRFGHQIIRDTAYGSLLKRARAALHERFVTWAERVNRERGRELEFEEILGYHLEQAYVYRTGLGVIDAEAEEVGRRAAAKLSNAGRRALTRGDLPAATALLRRATLVLQSGSSERIEVLVDLADALIQQGLFDDAKEVLDGARIAAAEIGDARLGARVELIEAGRAQFVGGPDLGPRALETVAATVPILEQAGDDAGLARAARLEMYTKVMAGRLKEATAASARILEHARRAGDERLVSRSAAPIAYILVHGPEPVENAITRAREMLAEVRGDRKTEAIILGALAQLQAMNEEFDPARTTYRAAQDILLELGTGVDASSTSMDSAQVELLAGNVDAAERELRRDYDALEALGEVYLRSTIAAMLAETLWRAVRADEAERFATVSAEIADPDDILSQVLWRIVRSKILADRGEIAAATALAEEALESARATEEVGLLAETLVGLAYVRTAAGMHEEARAPLDEALALLNAKGDRATARRLASPLISAV
ncbi:MAG TPA: adenylate/guanylate cyclase domain-containing protein [Candidatus Limnocylindrales bacterium]|nr:adenylate/guanylate cyclase domain-containing protein [Candidatus Limnocylindrales bacterium]